MEFNSTFNITIGNVSIAENEITSEIYPNPVDDKLYINSKDNIEEIKQFNIVIFIEEEIEKNIKDKCRRFLLNIFQKMPNENEITDAQNLQNAVDYVKSVL